MTALSDKFIDWKNDINSISEDSLESEANIGTSVSPIVTIINSIVNKIGNLSSLSSPNASLVAAINGVESSALFDTVGALVDLETVDKTTVVAAVNETHDYIGNYSSNFIAVSEINNIDNVIGDLTTLQTADKTTVVDAINEIDAANIESASLFSFSTIHFNSQLAFEHYPSNTFTLYPGKGTINGVLYSWGTITRTGVNQASYDAMIYIYLVGGGSAPTIEFLSSVPSWDTTKREWLFGEKRCIGWYKMNGSLSNPFKGFFDGEEITIRFYRSVFLDLILKNRTYQTTIGTLSISTILPANLINKFAVKITISTENFVGCDMLVAIGPTTWTGALHGAVAAIRSDNSITGYKAKEINEIWIPTIPNTTPGWVAYRYTGSPYVYIHLSAASFRV